MKELSGLVQESRSKVESRWQQSSNGPCLLSKVQLALNVVILLRSDITAPSGLWLYHRHYLNQLQEELIMARRGILALKVGFRAARDSQIAMETCYSSNFTWRRDKFIEYFKRVIVASGFKEKRNSSPRSSHRTNQFTGISPALKVSEWVLYYSIFLFKSRDTIYEEI